MTSFQASLDAAAVWLALECLQYCEAAAVLQRHKATTLRWVVQAVEECHCWLQLMLKVHDGVEGVGFGVHPHLSLPLKSHHLQRWP